jgi:hypothetical protein
VEDKVDDEVGYNALNIPKKYRRMYIAPPGKVLVSADWKNQEGRLMAYFSQDEDYIEAFKREDEGGVDVHSQNGALVYGCGADEARDVDIIFNGQTHSARHGGKVANHAWSYSPTPINTLIGNYSMKKEEAIRIDKVLTEARPRVAEYKKELVEQVLGKWEVRGDKRGRKTARCVESGTRFLANPWGWQMYFWGVGGVKKDVVSGEDVAMPVQAGEVVAFLQQSSGAMMWDDCALALYDEYGYTIYHGAYDSITLCVDDDRGVVEKGIEDLRKVMGKEWSELEGMKFPIDVSVGYNLGPWKEKVNEGGLRDV